MNAPIRLSFAVVFLSLAAAACGGAAQNAPRTAAWDPRALREDRHTVDPSAHPPAEIAFAQRAPRAQEATTTVLRWWPRERHVERAPIARPALRPSRR